MTFNLDYYLSHLETTRALPQIITLLKNIIRLWLELLLADVECRAQGRVLAAAVSPAPLRTHTWASLGPLTVTFQGAVPYLVMGDANIC